MTWRPGIVAASKRRLAGSPPPPPPPAGGIDPYWGNVVLRTPFDDGQFLTEYSDRAHVLTNNGATQLDPAKFGMGLNPQSGHISVPHNADFIFDGEFTIEGWTMHTINNQSSGVITKYNNSINERSWAVTRNIGALRFYASLDGSSVPVNLLLQSSSSANNNIWFHFAIDRDVHNVIRAYVDGVMVDSATLAGTLFNSSSQPLKIGAIAGDTSAAWTRGDDMRITKGIARYASNAGFTPPASAFPIAASGTISAPTVVATSGANGQGSSINATIPAGAVAGDTMIVFAGHAWPINSIPAGWSYRRQTSQANWNNAVFAGVLTGTDISNGFVTFGATNSGDYVYNAIAVEGEVTFGPITGVSYGSPADPRTLTSSFGVRSGMLCLLYGDAHLWDDLIIDTGTQVQEVNISSDGSAVLNTYTPGVDGEFTMQIDYQWGNSGGQSLVILPIFNIS